MEQQQIEKTLEILKKYHDLFNISNEFKNRIPKQHHGIINDLIIEIENIADLLMVLENELYYEYLNQ